MTNHLSSLPNIGHQIRLMRDDDEVHRPLVRQRQEGSRFHSLRGRKAVLAC